MKEKVQEELVGAKGALSGALIQKVDPITSGKIQQTWRIILEDGRRFFGKTTHKKDLQRLHFEAEGLQVLRNFANKDYINIPKVVKIQEIENEAILLMPWLDLGEGDQKLLGEGLALLHKNSIKHNPGYFGWEIEGYIGEGKQLSGKITDWGECFVNLRIKPQLTTAKKWGVNVNDFTSILDVISNYLDKHNPEPSIVHGDLWSGNFGIQKDGKGVLIDPATWWADREVDIAMTKLFGGFSNEFYMGYENIYPLDIFAKTRFEIYNLYHVLNHANIFGGSYKNQFLSSIRNIERMFS